ncbi:MAG: hypothetical protein ABI831_26620, partial [Betaproteobacteria bacterium]
MLMVIPGVTLGFVPEPQGPPIELLGLTGQVKFAEVMVLPPLLVDVVVLDDEVAAGAGPPVTV